MDVSATPSAPDTTHAPEGELVVHACSGETASALLAQDVAARLRALRPRVAGVVAIDGCGSGCSVRRLAGQGIQATAISLSTFGVELGVQLDEGERDALADRIAALLESGERLPAALAPRKRHEPPAAGGVGAAATHSVDDYLFAVSLLTAPVGACGVVTSDVPTLAAHVARALGVSRASAGEMLVRIEEAGDIERGPDRAIVLTARGRAAAERVVARHRIVERFLMDVLGYSAGESHGLALRMRGTFPDDAVDRLRALVLPAATCPHGWPLEPGTGIESAADLVALPALPAGTRRRVAALDELDGAVLARLCELGLEPGIEVEVVSTAPAHAVVVDGHRLELGPGEAAAVLVLLGSAA